MYTLYDPTPGGSRRVPLRHDSGDIMRQRPVAAKQVIENKHFWYWLFVSSIGIGAWNRAIGGGVRNEHFDARIPLTPLHAHNATLPRECMVYAFTEY